MSWDRVGLSTVADVFNGKTPSKAEQRDEGFPVLKIKDVDENFKFRGAFQSFVDDEFYAKHKAKKIQLHDSMILNAAHNSDYVGSKQYCAEEDVVDSVATGEWLVCRAKQGVLSPKFLNFWLRSEAARFEMKGLVKGIHLYPKDVARLEIPLPPLEAQKQIAAILEKADQLRKDSQQMEQELNNLAQSVFMDMFGGMELDCRLEEHIDFLTSGSRGWAKYYSDSGSRFIRSLDVQMNYIGNADVAYVSAPDGREAERTRVAPGDVLLTITGSRIGRVAWVPVDFDEAYISQHVALLRLKETLIPQFLSYFLSLPALGQRQIAKSQYGQTKPGLKLDHIKEFVLPRLTVNQQQCFVDFMSKQEKLLKYAKLQLLEADIGFDSIIRKAFSGKLNLKNKAA